jgi:hypothetical protein
MSTAQMPVTMFRTYPLCASCGCGCQGDDHTVRLEWDEHARTELPVFRHKSEAACDAAKARSDSFWGAEARP